MAETPKGWADREAVLRLLLEANGQPLGTPARKGSKVRRVQGGKEEAEELFGKLAELGNDSPVPGVPMRRVELSGVGHASYREASKTGPPTVDVSVNIAGLEKVKFKFVGSEGL